MSIRICPGSNDRFLWQFSEAKEYMEQLRQNDNFMRRYYILGEKSLICLCIYLVLLKCLFSIHLFHLAYSTFSLLIICRIMFD